MKNKYQRTNEFLNTLKEILIQNPNLNINSDANNSLYTLLVTYDIINTRSKTTLAHQGVFDNWKRRFRNSEDININIEKSNSYIEISNINIKNTNPKNYMCLQVPIDHKHIENSINLLIDFFKRSKINHITTISSTEKSDNVIIKLENQNDIDIICDYINNNKYIKEGLIEANPFIYNYKGFALFTGNQLSFNQTLTEYVRIYIDCRFKENKLNLIGSKDFIEFLKDYYNKVFINRSELDNHCTYFKIPETKNSTNLIVNYMSITEQIIKNSDPKFSITKLLEHYEEYKNTYSFNEKIIKFQHFKLNNENINQTNRILKILFEYLSLQYNEEETIYILESVIFENQNELITRKEGLRELLIEYNFSANMLSIFQDKKMSLSEYLRSLNISKKSDSQIKYEIDEILFELFTFYCENISPIENENIKTTVKRIKYYIETKDHRLITRSNHLRKKLINSFFVEKINYILKNRNIDFEKYADELIKNNKIGLSEYLENAIGETYEKYMYEKEQYENSERKKQNNEIKYIHSGRDAAIYALNEFFAFGHYSVFTRNNNARQELESNVSLIDAVNIMRKALKYPTSDKKTSIDELNYLIPNYVDLVLENYQIKKILK